MYSSISNPDNRLLGGLTDTGYYIVLQLHGIKHLLHAYSYDHAFSGHILTSRSGKPLQ